jgi:SAM-dependent methyltransferase
VSRAQLELHRRVWSRKPVLADVYGVWFRRILDAVGPAERVIEVGAGPGFLAPWARGLGPAPAWTATDLVPAPWNDAAADAMRLPLPGGAVDAVVGLDFVHHLARPRAFFTEAARVLRPRGVVVAVEPWVTPLSYPIYRWLHQEGCRLDLDPWDPFGTRAGGKDAFEGDAAVLWRLVRAGGRDEWPRLGFEPPRVSTLNGFAYLLSLGFKEGCLLPRPLARAAVALDGALGFLAGATGMRALAVWRRAA